MLRTIIIIFIFSICSWLLVWNVWWSCKTVLDFTNENHFHGCIGSSLYWNNFVYKWPPSQVSIIICLYMKSSNRTVFGTSCISVSLVVKVWRWWVLNSNIFVKGWPGFKHFIWFFEMEEHGASEAHKNEFLNYEVLKI